MSYSIEQQEALIIKKIKTFINHFGNNSKIGVDFFNSIHHVNKNDMKKKDYLSSIITKIENSKEILNCEVKKRASGLMLQKISTVNNDLDYILSQIKPHQEIGKRTQDNTTHVIDDKEYTMTEEDYHLFRPVLNKEVEEINGINYDSANSVFRSGKRIYMKNEFNLEDYESFLSYSKKDIYLLGYYELIYMYKQRGIVFDFKIKALQLLRYKCNYNLKGNNLSISLYKISNDQFSLEICENQLEELKKNNKILYPAFTASI